MFVSFLCLVVTSFFLLHDVQTCCRWFRIDHISIETLAKAQDDDEDKKRLVECNSTMLSMIGYIINGRLLALLLVLLVTVNVVMVAQAATIDKDVKSKDVTGGTKDYSKYFDESHEYNDEFHDATDSELDYDEEASENSCATSSRELCEMCCDDQGFDLPLWNSTIGQCLCYQSHGDTNICRHANKLKSACKSCCLSSNYQVYDFPFDDVVDEQYIEDNEDDDDHKNPFDDRMCFCSQPKYELFFNTLRSPQDQIKVARSMDTKTQTQTQPKEERFQKSIFNWANLNFGLLGGSFGFTIF